MAPMGRDPVYLRVPSRNAIIGDIIVPAGRYLLRYRFAIPGSPA